MAPEYNTFSSSVKILALAAITISISTTAVDSIPATVPHAIVERSEITGSSLVLKNYVMSQTGMVIDETRQNKIDIKEFSAKLFDGIRSYTEDEAKAHARILKNQSKDSGVNILAYLQ